mmetsp:Transcript_12736/g.14612  ORF Transcript_12736/g.14612 Transcript_12736/m.14612 type:complete len:152 (-) Transcript_12736:1137-1592(-)
MYLDVLVDSSNEKFYGFLEMTNKCFCDVTNPLINNMMLSDAALFTAVDEMLGGLIKYKYKNFCLTAFLNVKREPGTRTVTRGANGTAVFIRPSFRREGKKIFANAHMYLLEKFPETSTFTIDEFESICPVIATVSSLFILRDGDLKRGSKI